jgi:uncharacterized ion transporter superfamily protein YfcC
MSLSFFCKQRIVNKMIKMEKFKLDAFFLITMLILVTAVLTWVLPGGTYDRVEQDGRQVVVEGTYQTVDSDPQGVFDVLKSPIKGFEQTAEIIFFILIIGGFFSVLEKTGTIGIIIKNMALFFNSHETIKMFYIPVLMTLISLGGAILGLGEELIVLTPLIISISLVLGYDTIVGISISLVAAATGYSAGFLNPFNVGIAQGVAEIPLYSGIGYRLIVWIVFTGIAIFFTMRYAMKIQKNPELSLTAKMDKEKRKEIKILEKTDKVTLAHKLIMFAFGGALILLVWGIVKQGWYIQEIAALFLGLSFLTAVIYRMNPAETSSAFARGAASLVKISIFIAFARAIVIVAGDGKILDPILHGLVYVFSKFHPIVSSQFMFIAHSIISFFVVSSSGQAVLTIPILAPLSDLIGLSRQITVLAFQLGQGIIHIFIPTSPIVLAILGIGRVSLSDWFSWCWKLVLILTITAMLLLIPPYFMGW